MGVRGGCNVGEESSIRRGCGGCIGEYTSGSRCQRLPTGGDLHGQAVSHNRREGSFGLKPGIEWSLDKFSKPGVIYRDGDILLMGF